MTGGEKVSITDFLDAISDQLIIDVRSPAEHTHAHIPGAVNIPIFDDEERKVIGTIYKQRSRELAIKRGLDFFGPKMRLIIERVERLMTERASEIAKSNGSDSSSSTTLFVYCWRGGMRSAAMAWLLQLYGFKVILLSGGYKSYRRWALEALEKPCPLQVLGGYTGSGKTEVLQELNTRGEIVIDLEQLACHKGSAFGKQGLQPSQEMFENKLALSLYDALKRIAASSGHDDAPERTSIWVEDESQRIGSLNLPVTFWNCLRQSPVLFLDIPFEQRLQHIIDEYGKLDKEYIAGGIQRISKRLGGVETKHALMHLDQNNLMACFEILLRYYDKSYLKGLHNRNGLSTLLTKFSCDSVTTCNANLLLSNLSTV
jgi:tRNA 2-selenouridine synthase